MAKYNKFNKLDLNFYLNPNVVEVARELLGKIIVKQEKGKKIMARIVETEAYEGAEDAASHAYQNKRTIRTETMYASGGTAYVYLCYGMHHLFNIVTNQKDIPHAVLIRAIEPLSPLPDNHPKQKRKTGSGPALVTRYLNITREHDATSLLTDAFFIVDDGYQVRNIRESPRIGVAYAGAAALWPYRFFIQDHPHVTPGYNY
ncbi:MAG: DNA-3-methyladenine glycosylase [Bacteroidetes bacterium]|nr:DNA-3-methyladenine glycosylase [Bacteroidota bacterium]